jgi:SAM-dependent methyltransferase
MPGSHGRYESLAEVARELVGHVGAARDDISNVLDAGCGERAEAEALATAFDGARVVAVDLSPPDPGSGAVQYLRGDVRVLPFPDRSIDLLYSYHVLEHVDGVDRALREFRRVLRPHGVAFIGFPNRNRLIGYLNTPEPISDRVRWNLADWRARVTGTFHNEDGAHAGFAQAEMLEALSAEFERVTPVREDYYCLLYPRQARLIRLFNRAGIFEFCAPGNYFVCTAPRGLGGRVSEQRVGSERR